MSRIPPDIVVHNTREPIRYNQHCFTTCASSFESTYYLIAHCMIRFSCIYSKAGCDSNTFLINQKCIGKGELE